MWAERRAPCTPAWLSILALHLALFALWNTRPQLPDAPRPWSELRLIPNRPAALPGAAPSPLPPTLPAPPQGTVWPAPEVRVAPEPELDALPAVQPPAPAAVDIPQGAPLRLTLPGAGAPTRQPALDDPRGNTPTSRFGARMANDLGGDGRWVEERMDTDFVRLRRGNTCINLYRNNGAARQRFNESTSPTLWGATPAYRCERR